MDQLLLERLVAELRTRLKGRRIDRAYAIPDVHLAIVVGTSGAPRLWFSTEPDEPHLYERSGPHPTPDRPPAFAMAVRKLGRGRAISGLHTVGGDRVVALEWGRQGAGRLVFELIPRRATAILVDEEGTVRSVWHPRRGRPGVGDPYEPPSPPPGDPIDELEPADWERLERRGEAEEVARGVLRSLRDVPGLVAREAAARHAAGEDLKSALQRELERARSEPTDAIVYAPAPLERLATLPPSRRFVLAPYELRHVGDLVATHFPTLRDAADAFYPLRAHLRRLDRARDVTLHALKTIQERAERALEAVSRDDPDPDAEERYRRWGDLLLAHPDAERGDGTMIVPDDYGDGEPVEIPVDPEFDQVANAQRYYRKARRAERGRRRTGQRRAALDRKVEIVHRIRKGIQQGVDLDDLGTIADTVEALGGQVDPDDWSDAEARQAIEPDDADDAAEGRPAETVSHVDGAAASAEEPTGEAGGRRVEAGIVAFESADGLEILVGKNARANDRLTHELANRHDWWFHADGPGSHVIVRNPTREEEPPADTLRQAAALAAWFSFARESTKVDVRWTRVRHLRRPKGGAPGLVILERERTVLAEPVEPEELLEFEADAG